MKKTGIIVAATFCSVLMLAGCGGNNKETTAVTKAAVETEAASVTEKTEAETEAATTETVEETAAFEIGDNQLFSGSSALPTYGIIVDKPESIFPDNGISYEYESGTLERPLSQIKAIGTDADGNKNYIIIKGQDRETPEKYISGIHYTTEDEPRYVETTLGDTVCYTMDDSDDKYTRLVYLVQYELEDGSPVTVEVKFMSNPDDDKEAIATDAAELIKHISVHEMES